MLRCGVFRSGQEDGNAPWFWTFFTFASHRMRNILFVSLRFQKLP